MCLLGVSVMNNHIYGSKVPQNPHIGGISSQICKKFKYLYLQICVPDWHETWQAATATNLYKTHFIKVINKYRRVRLASIRRSRRPYSPSWDSERTTSPPLHRRWGTSDARCRGRRDTNTFSGTDVGSLSRTRPPSATQSPDSNWSNAFNVCRMNSANN